MDKIYRHVTDFYKSDLGRYTYDILSNKLLGMLGGNEALKNNAVICSAGCFPMAQIFLKQTETVGFHVYRDKDAVSRIVDGRVIRCDRLYWPYRAETIDTVILCHDLEFTDKPEAYLREIWRVLKGEGRVFIILPNRKGKWARDENTPFGYGHPYHFKTLQSYLERAHFKVDQVGKALFFPPYQPHTFLGQISRNIIDSLGDMIGFTSGVRIIEVSKHIYAPTRGLKEIVGIPAEKILGVRAGGLAGHNKDYSNFRDSLSI